MKAAIIAGRQESLGLAKDGNTLLGPVLPHLLARHGKGGPGGKTGGGCCCCGFRRSTGGNRGKAAAVKRCAHKAGTENVSGQNAGASAPAAAAAAAGAAARAAPAVANP